MAKPFSITWRITKYSPKRPFLSLFIQQVFLEASIVRARPAFPPATIAQTNHTTIAMLATLWIKGPAIRAIVIIWWFLLVLWG
ncbi:MAG: hypothetical protein WBW16_14515 [Bacteroidota bacterium]